MPSPAALAITSLVFLAAQPELRPVDEGFEDVSPLAAPTFVEPIDLRKPSGFDRVYEITTPSGEKAFVRIDNGLVAIFKRSDYAAGSGDAFIPPNTRFHIGTQDIIGGQTTQSYTPTAASRRGGRPNTRVSNRVPNVRLEDARPLPTAAIEPEPEPTAGDQSAGPPSIITNEYYRRLRIAQLLQSAIAAD